MASRAQKPANQSPQRTKGVTVCRDSMRPHTTAGWNRPASATTRPDGSMICETPVAALRTR